MDKPIKKSKTVVVKWLCKSDYMADRLMNLLYEADPRPMDGNTVYDYKRKSVCVGGTYYNQVKLKVSYNLSSLVDYIEKRVEMI